MKHPPGCAVITACLASILLCLSLPVRADGPQGRDALPVFVLAGQSNMVGVGARQNAEKLPEQFRGPQQNVLFVNFWATEFKPFEPKQRIGPEISFGAEMAKGPADKVGLVKLAVGGSSLKGHWNPTEYDKEKGVGVFYKRLIDYVKNVRAKNPDIRIAGMLWMQGEADSRYGKIKVEDYREKLEALIDACRKEFGNEKMPFVCGRINPPPGWNNRAEVREAQETARREHYAFVDCDDLELGGDRLHFTVNGQVELGRRFAAAMLTLMNEEGER